MRCSIYWKQPAGIIVWGTGGARPMVANAFVADKSCNTGPHLDHVWVRGWKFWKKFVAELHKLSKSSLQPHICKVLQFSQHTITLKRLYFLCWYKALGAAAPTCHSSHRNTLLPPLLHPFKIRRPLIISYTRRQDFTLICQSTPLISQHPIWHQILQRRPSKSKPVASIGNILPSGPSKRTARAR